MNAKNMTVALAVAVLLMAVGSVQAATITYAGADTTVGQYYRTSNQPGATKPMDVGATTPDNIYGTDGTVFFNTSGSSSVQAYNYMMLDRKPTYFTSVNPGDSRARTSDYTGGLAIDNPELSGVDPVANITYGYIGFGTAGGWAGPASPSDLVAFSMTLGSGIPANGFRVGMFVNFLGTTAPTSVKVQIGGVSDISPGTISDDGSGDMYFFDVNGASSGDVLEFRLTGNRAFTLMRGVTFDTLPIPEPSALSLLGLFGGAFLLRLRRRNK